MSLRACIQAGLALLILPVSLIFLSMSGPALAQENAKLSGTVYFNGEAMSELPVSLYSADDVLQTTTDRGGLFAFTNLAPGRYDLEAQSEWDVEGAIYGIQIGKNDIGPLAVMLNLVDVVFPLDVDCGRAFWVSYKADAPINSELNGEVDLVADDSLPSTLAQDARVYLTKQDGGHPRVSRSPDKNGRIEFKGLPPGRYSLLAYRRGYWKVRSTIWITRRETATVKIILRKHGHPAICE